MPELPDITVYLEALEPRVVQQPLQAVTVRSPFLVRSYDPPLDSFVDGVVLGVSRMGKRIVFEFDGDRFLIFHLMIAGRFRWRDLGATLPGGKNRLATFQFPTGVLIMTEAGTKKRASLYAVVGSAAVDEHNPGGLEVSGASLDQFRERLTSANHTLKRSLTSPKLFSGIGNAYSDELLHRAKISPIKLTQKLSDEEIRRLYDATRTTMAEWTQRLRDDVGDRFPEKVTAFRPEMAVHGKFKEPCPVCGSPVQRIVYSSNETNYCATCQTNGVVLKDRAMSRLLKDDWPRSIEDWEGHR